MKRPLLIAAALTLVAAGGAAAQDPHEDGHRPPAHPQGAPGGHQGSTEPQGGFHGGPPGREDHGGPPGREDHAGPPAAALRGGPAGAHFAGFRGQGLGPHGPARVFYHGRSFSSFRAAPFYYPGGWGYRRWGVGQFLPGLFLNQTYFIGNWGGYGLAPPPPGLQWVRYGPDALLVNVYTGQVVDTVYGVFWW
jgi:Ni/Co efflux regulator RcnB